MVTIQHYIPRCILKNFAVNNNKIYEVLILSGKIYLTNISNSMAERFTYEHKLFEINTLEKYFQRIENYLSPAVNNLISIIESSDNSKESISEIHQQVNHYLREFIIFYYRSGALLHEFSFMQQFSEDRILLLLNKLLNSQYIRLLSDTIKKFYSFSILKSSEGKFLVSDQYISTAAFSIKSRFADISNRQIGLKGVLILIPISKNYYIAYSNGRSPAFLKEKRINILNEEDVLAVNNVVINNSYQKSVSFDQESIKRALTQFIFRSPSKIMMGFESGNSAGAVLKKEVFYYQEDSEVWEQFESMNWLKYNGLGRNDICRCGSNKKFKYCHMRVYLESQKIMDGIKRKVNNDSYLIHPQCVVEQPIDQWSNLKPRKK